MSVERLQKGEDRPLALILKGGGVKGLALVGALLEMEKYYSYSAFVGTSAGAIVAGLLAAECTPRDLEKILRQTDFRKFLDAHWYQRLKNLALHFYLYPGRAFEEWLCQQVQRFNNKYWKRQPPKLKDMKTRLTIYAAQEVVGALVFDSDMANENRGLDLTFAIRCSMSIPAFFKPPTHNGRPVFDGGLLNNFPGRHWTSQNPDYDFIGVYLGEKVINPAGSSGLPNQLLNLITERDDPQFIDDHRERIIVVNPDPIKTYDFNLSAEETDFLVLQGRADALEHMYKFLPEAQRPSQGEVIERRNQANNAKTAASGARKRRKRNKRFRQSVVVIALIVLALALRFLNWPLYKSGAVPETVNKPVFTGPIEGLSRLGWTIINDSSGLHFEVKSKPLPSMKESATYFRQLEKPFSLHFHYVKSLIGLQQLANIGDCEHLEIAYGEISDISELAGFRKLTRLTIRQTPYNGLSVIDLSPISSLTNLRELNLAYAKIKNIDVLAGFTRLEKLNLMNTLVRDLSPLANHPSLKDLSIRGTEITDLETLRRLTTLSRLEVGGKQLPSLSKLANLKNLRALSITETKEIDLSPIGTLTNLIELSIYGLSHLNLSPLRKLTNLRVVMLTGRQYAGQGAPFADATVSDINALEELRNLQTLVLSSLQIRDLTFATRLKTLTALNLSDVPISSTVPLRDLTSLRKLSLIDTNVIDVSPLLDLQALNYLNVSGTPARADIVAELERRGVTVVW